MARIRVQHSSILGLLTPVAAPVFASSCSARASPPGRSPAGRLILFAGALVVVYGAGEPEPPL